MLIAVLMDEHDPHVVKLVKVLRSLEAARVRSAVIAMIGMLISLPVSIWAVGFLPGTLLFVGFSATCFGVSTAATMTFAKLVFDEVLELDEPASGEPVASTPRPGASEVRSPLSL